MCVTERKMCLTVNAKGQQTSKWWVLVYLSNLLAEVLETQLGGSPERGSLGWSWAAPRPPPCSPCLLSHQIPDTGVCWQLQREEALSGAVTGSRLIIRFISLRLTRQGDWRMLKLPASTLEAGYLFIFKVNCFRSVHLLEGGQWGKDCVPLL